MLSGKKTKNLMIYNTCVFYIFGGDAILLTEKLYHLNIIAMWEERLKGKRILYRFSKKKKKNSQHS